MLTLKHATTFKLCFDGRLCGRECEALWGNGQNVYCILFRKKLINKKTFVNKVSPSFIIEITENYMDRYLRCAECIKRFGVEEGGKK